MPMLQVNGTFWPLVRTGKSTSVVPVAGRTFWMPRVGKVIEREQPWVLLVTKLSLVGIPALSVILRGS